MAKSIAVIGASQDRSKFGNKAVRAYLRAGYQVFPVHPFHDAIEGQTAYRSVLDVPAGKLDRISLYLPPTVLRPILEEISQKPADQVWFNPGADVPDLVERARFLGMNAIVGCSIVDVGVSPYDLE